jgi:nucleotide-binding universal stress UspA family protein
MPSDNRPAAQMKLLIGFDGSDAARDAILDLAKAGLPPTGDATVLSVVDLAAELPYGAYAASPEVVPLAFSTVATEQMHHLTERAMLEAKLAADAGANLLQGILPQWTIRSEALAESPYYALIHRAEELKADLVVVGSHGRSAFGRVIFGSVSQNVLSHAPCSVRIGRKNEHAAAHSERASQTPQNPLRIMLAIDGSDGSALAAEAVSLRKWPADSEIRVVTAVDQRWQAFLQGFGDWRDVADSPHASLSPRRRVDSVARDLHETTGLRVDPIVVEGNIKRVLVQEAGVWQADCIFLGARGHSRLDRFLIGSVSMSVAARAHCSVEVIRQSR